MSFSHDRTSELWRTFRSVEKAIPNRKGTEAYSVKVYGRDYSFSSFDPNRMFEKWAAVEVSELNREFVTLSIPAGLYAVFIHHGPAATGATTFGYIFGKWLPASDYVLDARPHFEIIPENYDPFDPDAEEEVWVPVKKRS